MLGTTPVEQINISNVSIGTAYTGSVLPSGKTEAILIEGKAGTTARLEIGELIFNRNTCKTLALSDINAHKISIKDNIAHDQNFATKELTISSTVRAANWDVTGNYEVLLTEPTPPGGYAP